MRGGSEEEDLVRACGASRDEGGVSSEVAVAGEMGFDWRLWGLSEWGLLLVLRFWSRKGELFLLDMCREGAGGEMCWLVVMGVIIPCLRIRFGYTSIDPQIKLAIRKSVLPAKLTDYERMRSTSIATQHTRPTPTSNKPPRPPPKCRY